MAFISGHRTPPLPAPPRPAGALPPPPRPVAAAPTTTNEERELALFTNEFDILDIDDATQSKYESLRVDCHKSNLKYVPCITRTKLAYDYQAFFDRMIKYAWRNAELNTQNPRTGQARGVVMGAGRPTTAGTASQEFVPFHDFTGHKGPAGDWHRMSDLKRVNAYAFRGDSRGPLSIRSANGFHPPCTNNADYYIRFISEQFAKHMERYGKTVNPDEVATYIRNQGEHGKSWAEYEMWRSYYDRDKFNIRRMVDHSFLKGYISTSRDPMVARGFVDQGQIETLGVLCVVHVEGGFLLPPRETHTHGSNQEAEIAYPGSIPWSKVMAFRGRTVKIDVLKRRSWHTRVFVRKGAIRADRYGMEQALAGLIWGTRVLK